ncbi:MAG: hypothetical protein ACI308_02940 [Muribaculaceae bacterium]
MINSRLVIIAEVLVFAVIILISTHVFALADAAMLITLFTAAYLVTRITYSRMRHHSAVGVLALTAAWLTMSLLGINYIARSTVYIGHPFSDPLLWNDAMLYFDYAKSIYLNTPFTYSIEPYPGIALLTVLTWHVFGMNIVPPLAVNMMLTLFTIVLTGVLTYRLLEGRTSQSNQWVAGCAMVAAATLFFMLSHGTQLLKEPLCYFGVIVGALSLVRLHRRTSANVIWQPIAMFVAATLIIAFTRTTYCLTLLAGAALMLATCRRQWRTLLPMLALGTATYVCLTMFGHAITFGSYPTYFSPEQADAISYQYIIGDNQAALGTIVGSYFNLQWWQKLLWLPFTCAVQFIIPFPWVTGHCTISEVVPRISFFWYAIGGIAIFYVAWLSWRKSTSLGWWTLWAIMCFAMPAYVVAGSVSRYALPFQPLFIPMAIYVIALLRQGMHRKPFAIFATAYVLVIAVTLTVCHHLQSLHMS